MKLPPGALLAIADDLLADIYTIWLLLPDICRLDSAVCAQWLRPNFLRLVRTKVVRFLREIYNPLAGRFFSLQIHGELRSRSMVWILKRGINLASLRLPDFDRITQEEKEEIRTAVTSLLNQGLLDKVETIDIFRGNYIRDHDLAAVLEKGFATVKSVDIRQCVGLGRSMAQELKRCTELEVFRPNGDETIVEMKEIFQVCKKLKTVIIGYAHSTSELIQCIAEHCRLLAHLDVSGEAVYDEAIIRVALSCPLLVFVSLWMTNVTDASVVALCTRCPQLKVIELHGAHLTDMSVLAIAEKLPGLTSISLPRVVGITSSAVETLVSKCRMLEHIDLGGCPSVCDATLSAIARHCPVLYDLIVTGCPLVTVSGLKEVGSCCTKIKLIVIDRKHSGRALLLRQLFPSVKWFI